MNIDWKSRSENKYFIMAILSVIAIVNKRLGYPSLLPEELDVIADTIFEVLVVLGIIVNPTTHGFTDDKSEKEINIDGEMEL